MKFLYQGHEIEIWQQDGKPHYQIKDRNKVVIETGSWSPLHFDDNVVDVVKEIIDQLILPKDHL